MPRPTPTPRGGSGQALRAREQEEMPGKAMTIAIFAGLIMLFAGAAYALYSATKILAWMVS